MLRPLRIAWTGKPLNYKRENHLSTPFAGLEAN